MSKIDSLFIEYIKETEYNLIVDIPFSDDEILNMHKKTFTYSLFKCAFKHHQSGVEILKPSINDGTLQGIAKLKTNIMIGYIKDTVVEKGLLNG
jgi:hypothetical protein